MTLPSRPPLRWTMRRGLFYDDGERWQAEALSAVAAAPAAGGRLLLAEFHPVVTAGRGARAEHLLASPLELERAGVAFRRVARGGGVTGHGPGQWTVYPVAPLRRLDGGSVRGYLRRLEGAVITFLARYGVTCTRREGLSGVWAGRKKLAAVGIAVSRWTTWHGIAVNIEPESTSWTRWVIPCGLDSDVGGVGSLSEIAGRRVGLDECAGALAEDVARALDMDLIKEPTQNNV